MSYYGDTPNFSWEAAPGLDISAFKGPGRGSDRPHVLITKGDHYIIVTLEELPALVESLAAAAFRLRQELGRR